MNEAITVSSYIDVARRAEELNLLIPKTLAVLPRNFKTAETAAELKDESSAVAVQQLWREAGLPVERFDSPDDPLPAVAEHSVNWIGPTIFIGAGLVSENSALIDIALGVIADYVHELFGRLPGKRRVKLEVVMEREGEAVSKRITYDGDADGLEALLPAVKEALNDQG
jgi:hypothetical protein